MNRKKNILLFFILTILILSSCVGSGGRSQMLTSDKDIAYNRLETILDALNNKDRNALKAMFSKQVLMTADDIDISIDYLFNLFQGEVISCEEDGLITSEEINYGNRIKELKAFFIVNTDIQQYLFFILEYVNDSKNTDNIGLYTLRVIKAEDKKNQYGSWQKMKIAGIYRPN